MMLSKAIYAILVEILLGIICGVEYYDLSVNIKNRNPRTAKLFMVRIMVTKS